MTHVWSSGAQIFFGRKTQQPDPAISSKYAASTEQADRLMV